MPGKVARRVLSLITVSVCRPPNKSMPVESSWQREIVRNVFYHLYACFESTTTTTRGDHKKERTGSSRMHCTCTEILEVSPNGLPGHLDDGPEHFLLCLLHSAAVLKESVV